MKQWRVSYENLEWKAGRRPFWKCQTVVRAESRRDAIEQVIGNFPPPKYGNFKAARTDVGTWKCRTEEGKR